MGCVSVKHVVFELDLKWRRVGYVETERWSGEVGRVFLDEGLGRKKERGRKNTGCT